MTAVTHNASPDSRPGDACDASSPVARFARVRVARFNETRHPLQYRVTGDAFSQVLFHLYAQVCEATNEIPRHHASPAATR